MRTTRLLGCAVAVLAVAGCGKATQNAGDAQNTPSSSAASTTASSSAPASTTPTTSAGPTTSPSSTTPTPSTVPTKTPAATTSDKPSAQPAGSRCTTSDLWAVFTPMGAAAGNLYGKIVLTNHSGASCTVYGYGGIALFASSGKTVPTHQVRNPSVAPVTITLRPGDHAYSRLHWSDVPGQGEDSTSSACEPTASKLQVIPPDETRPLDAHWPGSPACEHGRIEQDAYRAGAGPSSGG